MSAPLLRGPRWADVRLHRGALWTGLGLVVLADVVMVYLRWANHAYPEPADNCVGNGPCDTFLGFSSARALLHQFVQKYSQGMLVIPILIGAFVAGPVIAREMESGTHKLAWTQSMSPARWLLSKLTVFAVTRHVRLRADRRLLPGRHQGRQLVHRLPPLLPLLVRPVDRERHPPGPRSGRRVRGI